MQIVVPSRETLLGGCNLENGLKLLQCINQQQSFDEMSASNIWLQKALAGGWFSRLMSG